MAKVTSYKPAEYHSVTPSLVVQDAVKAIQFYVKAFGAALFPVLNERFVAILGSSKRQIIGLDTRSLPDQEIVKCVNEALAGRAATYRGDYRSVTGNKVTPVHVDFAPIFGAGFYYKTFMWPAAFWEKLYEPAIRRAAGLGRASLKPDPETPPRRGVFCGLRLRHSKKETTHD